MIHKLAWATVLAALALAWPGAAASWSFMGVSEPDTGPDRARFMFTDPPGPDVAGRAVYLNAFPVEQTSVLNGYAIASPHGAFPPVRSFGLGVLLGTWVDCDGDGSVGRADGAWWVYRRELVSSTPCDEDPRRVRQGWVREFLWLTPKASDKPLLPDEWRHDGATSVWGDFGPPGGFPTFPCPDVPTRGQWERTGGYLGFVDCHFDHTLAREASSLPGLEGLAFEDPDRPESDCHHPLNQPVPGGAFGNDPCQEDTGWFESGANDPAFAVWDCSRPDGFRVEDPTATEGEEGVVDGLVLDDPTGQVPPPVGDWPYDPTPRDDGSLFTYTAPREEPTVNPGGSLVEGVDNMKHGLTKCQPSTDPGPTISRSGDNPPEPGATEGKRKPNLLGFYQVAMGTSSATDAEGVPAGLGLGATHGFLQAGWRTDAWTPPDYLGPTVTRHLEPAGPMVVTVYARLGVGTLAVAQTPGSTGSYGAEACGSHVRGVHRGWQCEASLWWHDLDGNPDPRGATAPRLGWAYHLRDTDCYDQEVAPGVRVGTLILSDEACP